jgi:hypothetical protein
MAYPDLPTGSSSRIPASSSVRFCGSGGMTGGVSNILPQCFSQRIIVMNVAGTAVQQS